MDFGAVCHLCHGNCKIRIGNTQKIGDGMTIFNFISLFGGLALFLYGMQLMGDGLKNGSSGALEGGDGEGDEQSARRLPARPCGHGGHSELHGDHRAHLGPCRRGRADAAPVHRHHPRRERRHDHHGSDHPTARPQRRRRRVAAICSSPPRSRPSPPSSGILLHHGHQDAAQPTPSAASRWASASSLPAF